jgi:hypothetical protein
VLSPTTCGAGGSAVAVPSHAAVSAAAKASALDASALSAGGFGASFFGGMISSSDNYGRLCSSFRLVLL